MDLLRRWVARQFTTRVIVLMPVAIAINIVLGATVQQGLKLPIYLDSIGTILVGVLAGPLAGALTGILSNLIWGYLLPSPIGSHHHRPVRHHRRRDRPAGRPVGPARPVPAAPRPARSAVAAAVVAVVLVGALALYTYARAYAEPGRVHQRHGLQHDSLRPVARLLPGRHGRLRRPRRPGARSCAATSARSSPSAPGSSPASWRPIVSAPIAAVVYGGVTGSGTDALVAAFRAGGDSLYQATLKQGLLSDPMDKMITSFVVFFIIGSLSHRVRGPVPERREGDRLAGDRNRAGRLRGDLGSSPRSCGASACPTTSSAGRAASTARPIPARSWRSPPWRSWPPSSCRAGRGLPSCWRPCWPRPRSPGGCEGWPLIGLAASPIVGSILLINLFLLPGAADPIARLGPLAPTWSGLWFGLETTARLLAFSLGHRPRLPDDRRRRPAGRPVAARPGPAGHLRRRARRSRWCRSRSSGPPRSWTPSGRGAWTPRDVSGGEPAASCRLRRRWSSAP